MLINPPAALLGTRNAILRGRGRQHFVEDFPGPLSIKCVLRGSGHWSTEDGDFELDEDALLVLNHNQPYDLVINAPEPVITCCLFFEKGFVEAAFQSIARLDRMLDDPQSAGPSLRFAVRMETDSPTLLRRIHTIDRAIAAGCVPDTWLDEQFLEAARELLQLDETRRKQMLSVPAVRPSTRAEIYRRLCRAREFLYAHRSDTIQLADVAREACLSRYHLHRLFAATFGETPHQHLRRLRLERAAFLLARSDATVTAICFDCGFSSLGSFSALFRRVFGVAPVEFRRISASSKKPVYASGS